MLRHLGTLGAQFNPGTAWPLDNHDPDKLLVICFDVSKDDDFEYDNSEACFKPSDDDPIPKETERPSLLLDWLGLHWSLLF